MVARICSACVAGGGADLRHIVGSSTLFVLVAVIASRCTVQNTTDKLAIADKPLDAFVQM